MGEHVDPLNARSLQFGEPLGEGLWHVLRHTFASHLVMRGAAMKVVQELLGHATMEMTTRYSHLSPDVPRHAVKLLDGLGSDTPPAGRQVGDKAHFST